MSKTDSPNTLAANINSDIAVGTNNEVQYRISPARLAVAFGVLAGGALLLVSGLMIPTAVGTLLIVLGALEVLAGLIMLAVRNKKPVYVPTNSPVRLHTIYFDSARLETARRALERKDFAVASTAILGDESNMGAKADIYLSADGKFVAIQTFRFIPHSYNPDMPLVCLHGAEVEPFCRSFFPQGK